MTSFMYDVANFEITKGVSKKRTCINNNVYAKVKTQLYFTPHADKPIRLLSIPLLFYMFWKISDIKSILSNLDASAVHLLLYVYLTCFTPGYPN